jgi:hypothetical protein
MTMTAKNDVSKYPDRIWFRKTMRTLTLKQAERDLDEKLKSGEITVEEAEAEYQDFLHRGEVWSEW